MLFHIVQNTQNGMLASDSPKQLEWHASLTQFKTARIACQLHIVQNTQNGMLASDSSNIFTQRKPIDKNRIIQIHMGIAKKVISTKFLNIIIRTNHGQTECVMQYGGLRSSVTCVVTSCSNDSFASSTHRTNQSLDKGL